MNEAGLRIPWSITVESLGEVEEALADGRITPAGDRPARPSRWAARAAASAATETELRQVVSEGLAASPINQVLVEESVIGWGEFELEVMRDRNDNVVIICSIENVDPMGVHTGDSVTVAPAQTLTDPLYQELRDQAIKVIRAIGVETGGSNVQFAVNPENGEIVVIEMNPRVSRSSALASKATGFPIAKMAAKLAVGYALEEIPNDITRATPASFEPTIDYVVTKIPRFAFEKFPGAEGRLSTYMQSVGEAMAIGRTFRESFAKAMRSRELDSAAEIPGRRRGAAGGAREALRRALRPDPRGLPPRPRRRGGARALPGRPLVPARAAGAGHRGRRHRGPRPHLQGGRHLRRRVRGGDALLLLRPTSARAPTARPPASEVRRGERDSVVILGAGPNRIGQGIEFDYCCVHAAMTARELGRDAVMINCNPETVSTDYDTSDRLYFEPLTAEDVLAVCEQEQPEGVIVQFGGQTPLKLARDPGRGGRAAARHPGRRDRPGRGPRPLRRPAAPARDQAPALRHRALGRGGGGDRRRGRLPAAGPALLRARRPGDGDLLLDRGPRPPTSKAHVKADQEHPLLLDRFLENAIEVDVDALADGEDGPRRRDHAARRGGRRPLRRLGLRDPADEPRRGDAGGDPRDDRADRARARRDRPDQHPVRRRRRRALRDRGQPARLAHRALRLQGDRGAAGEDRRRG